MAVSPKIVVCVVYVSALFMTILDSTVVNVALPSIAAQYGVAAEQAHAVVIGYLLSLAVFMPASGWFGDRFGPKAVFLTALGLFVAASALCGLSASLVQLVLFRVVQGAGGGLLVPVGLAMLLREFPPAERPRTSRILSIPTIVAPATGPVLGGLLTVSLSWRWVFYINVPLGALVFLFGLLFLHTRREQVGDRFDISGFLLAGAGLGAALYALSEGPDRGWLAPDVVGTGVGGLAMLVALVVVELRRSTPMLDLRLLSVRSFRTSSVVQFLSSGAFIGLLFLMPLFLQTVRGADPLTSGLTTFPEAIGVLCCVQVTSRIYPIIGPRRLQLVGLTSLTLVTAAIGMLDLSASRWLVMGLMFAAGLSMGCVFMPTQTAAFATMPNASLGRGAALYNVLRQLGSAGGVALLSSVVAAVGHPLATGFRLAFYASAALALLSAIAALGTRDADAAPTLRPQARVESAP